MAGAGQPWYMPLTWPVGHVCSALTMANDDAPPPAPTPAPSLDLVGHATSFAAAARSFLLAVACIYGLYEGDDYPAFSNRPLSLKDYSWMLPILVRNLAATWAICGFWDWFLYFSPLKEKLVKFKLNPRYPPMSQFRHDAFWTTSASATGAMVEILCCYCYAHKIFPEFDRDILTDGYTLTKTILLAITITHWRVPHFWAVHRGMHPWRNVALEAAGIPDVGRFLYRNVHALHHKSYNPTAFSGTSMHPVESTLYYSACLIPVPFGAHPAVVLGCIVDCAVGAWLGHDGYRWPGSGDCFHQLHHTYFDCNYGAMHFPIDKWLGTYVGGEADLGKVWKRVDAGADANDTPMHAEGAECASVESAAGGAKRDATAEGAGEGSVRRRGT